MRPEDISQIPESSAHDTKAHDTRQVEVDPMRPEAVPVFQAESPDEGAFVSAARNLGFFFCRRSMKDLVVRVNTPEVRAPARAPGQAARARGVAAGPSPLGEVRRRGRRRCAKPYAIVHVDGRTQARTHARTHKHAHTQRTHAPARTHARAHDL